MKHSEFKVCVFVEKVDIKEAMTRAMPRTVQSFPIISIFIYIYTLFLAGTENGTVQSQMPLSDELPNKYLEPQKVLH